MDQRLSVITLGVHDIARARKFYEEGLGWHRDAGEDDVAFYQTGSFVTALYEWPKLAVDAGVPSESSGFRGVALGYCTRSQSEVDDLLARAEASGARILVKARNTFWGGYDGYFADPDGHIWEIAWNPGWYLSTDGETRLQKPA